MAIDSSKRPSQTDAKVQRREPGRRLPKLFSRHRRTRCTDGRYELEARARSSIRQLDPGLQSWQHNRRGRSLSADRERVLIAEARPNANTSAPPRADVNGEREASVETNRAHESGHERFGFEAVLNARISEADASDAQAGVDLKSTTPNVSLPSGGDKHRRRSAQSSTAQPDHARAEFNPESCRWRLVRFVARRQRQRRRTVAVADCYRRAGLPVAFIRWRDARVKRGRGLWIGKRLRRICTGWLGGGDEATGGHREKSHTRQT